MAFENEKEKQNVFKLAFRVQLLHPPHAHPTKIWYFVAQTFSIRSEQLNKTSLISYTYIELGIVH